MAPGPPLKGASPPGPEEYATLKQSLSSWSDEQRTPPRGLAAHRATSPRPPPNMHIDINQVPMAAEIALAALTYLPTPIIVLNSLKTILLANEAMGRLLGLKDGDHRDLQSSAAPYSATEMLKGQTLSQIGVDMVQDGAPVWVSWEKFLDKLAATSLQKTPDPERATSRKLSSIPSADATPNTLPVPPSSEQVKGDASSKGATDGAHGPSSRHDTIYETAVDVNVSAQHHPLVRQASHGSSRRHSESPSGQTAAKMIISIWRIEGSTYYTLSFTSTAPTLHKRGSQTHVVTRPTSALSQLRGTPSSEQPASSHSDSSSAMVSPAEPGTSKTPFPPYGAPPKGSQPGVFTDFQKVVKMKDAMLSANDIPVIAMWKDESVAFPNHAARKMLAVEADPTDEESYDFMSRFKAYTYDFSRELELDESPIVTLCRSQRAFNKWKIGIIEPRTGKHRNYDVSGKPVFDEKTGEFCAGLVAFKDVTEYAEQIALQHAENEEQFELICNTIPQILWTTRPDGLHDYFSQRWYDYTGLNPGESLGLGWKLPFHPDDMEETGKRWKHSLATGDEYLTEYRCLRHDGQWRWMLGRALPLKNKEGKIVKWFGTCTDIQDIVDANAAAKRLKGQLTYVMKHARLRMWIVDISHKIQFYEGELVVNGVPIPPEQFVGQDIEVLSRWLPKKIAAQWMRQIEDVFSGRSPMEMLEHTDGSGRWQRTRVIAQKEKRENAAGNTEEVIVGCFGLDMDATEIKKKEAENVKLLAAEAAAKEASRLKSSFLANMSHEIRTPIAGIIGMSELMMDTTLDDEQQEFAQNIQRSANGLLTVINDILDFSKVESGRLDIEEVQFSLPTVLEDVSRMLSYAAERKKLDFISKFDIAHVTNLLGDPGRVRQILTNLLTNSIKFTTTGYVKMSVDVISETDDNVVIEFTVEDSGIGIGEDVKKKLFRPFSQADSSTARKFGGTGLGLTICKNLVELMHGKIELKSKLARGTIATFSVPFVRPQYTSDGASPLVDVSAFPDRLQSELSLSTDGLHASPPSRQATTGGTKPAHSQTRKSTGDSLDHGLKIPDEERKNFHILVVEDNSINQTIAVKTIKGLGFPVSAVWNGREALDYLLEAGTPENPMPSLILMDVQMPILDGYRATHLLRQHSPYKDLSQLQAIPIIAMTASAIQGDREKCEKAGMDDYLAKPVRRPLLERMIVKWLGGDAAKKRPNRNTKPRPSSSRTSTEDHGSECPGSEVGVDHGNQVSSAQPATDNDKKELESPTRTDSTDTESSKPGGQQETRTRREAAQEYASFLRDDKLLAATAEDPHTAGQRPNMGPRQSSNVPMESYKRKNSAGDNQVMALTEANVERLNIGTSDNGSRKANSIQSHRMRSPSPIDSTSQPHDGNPSSLSTGRYETLATTPSQQFSMPPPPLKRPGLPTSTHSIDGGRTLLVTHKTLAGTLELDRNPQVLPLPISLSPRFAVANSSAAANMSLGRQQSDWSESTVKPRSPSAHD